MNEYIDVCDAFDCNKIKHEPTLVDLVHVPEWAQ